MGFEQLKENCFGQNMLYYAFHFENCFSDINNFLITHGKY